MKIWNDVKTFVGAVPGIVKEIPSNVEPVLTVTGCGIATSRKAKVLLGGSMVAMGVGVVASTPVVVKTSLVVGFGMLMGACVTGFREGYEKTRAEYLAQNGGA